MAGSVGPEDEPRDGLRGTHVWGIVLAGGQGARLKALTRHVYGDDRPKQFAVLTGEKSLLDQTLDRARLMIPTERTVVVTMAAQHGYLAPALRRSPVPHVLEQPSDRGTAAAVLLAVRWVLARDPRAIVIVLPADHFVDDGAAFMGHVAAAVRLLDSQPSAIVMLGAEPTEPDGDYGWIELGAPITNATWGRVHRVRRFVEKPGPDEAAALYEAGALWNTFVFASRARSLVEVSAECLPALHERLARLPHFFGTEHERWAVRQAYELSAPANFSRAVLEASPDTLVAVPLSGVVWRDLGTPARVVRTLAELGLEPAWLSTLERVG
jgi:mannose-1-phosphate guanylyltransferase